AEEKTLRRLNKINPQKNIHLISWKTSSYKILYAFIYTYDALRGGKIKTCYQIARLLCKKHSLIVSVRALESLLTTICLKKELQTINTVFFISTESNPHGTALIHLAKIQKTKVFFIAHSPLIDNPLPVYFNAALFWGKAMDQQFAINGSIIHSSLFASTPHSPVTEPVEKQILIALSKNVDTESLKKLVISLQYHPLYKKYKISIRLHPNRSRSIDKMFRHFINAEETVDSALQKASLVIAGHSTFHLEALSRLKPSYYCQELDGTSVITLPFLRSGEVLTIETLLRADESEERRAYSIDDYNKIRNYYFQPSDTTQIYKEIIDWINVALK
ncbi:MAG: hypothetical protein IT287_00365, partial [Bdellovibrionaceae bacterium]|nr:hypothetical protein [Pseudobdellovibrionaceae bacterium]